MHPIIEKIEKPSRLVLGIMSGTSADGVDVALCRISGHGFDSVIQQLGFYFMPFEDDFRKEVLRIAGGDTTTASDFCKINFRLGLLYAKAAKELCAQHGLRPSDIDLIGSHGQTLWHIPVPEDYFGDCFPSTLQLGEGSLLAEQFCCPVISDFRVRDVAAGGNGAPLVPYSEFLIYRSNTEAVALQNIGGIGNVTYIPANASLDQIMAFDTGPGNMLIDAVYSFITKGEYNYDDGGCFASKGKVDEAMLEWLMQDPYIIRKPPKTTGREYYGSDYAAKIIRYATEKCVLENDLLATVTAFTAKTIAHSLRNYCPSIPAKLVIGGGGSMNKTLLAYIQEYLMESRVMTNESLGFDSSAKEAIAFAVLANETIFAGFNNVPSATGAKRPVVMGKISL